MLRLFHTRVAHYLLLTAASAALFLVNLGVPSLWDIDEGHNAEAAREMLVSGNWVVPTFNFQLRPDKPALLYWLQIAAYRVCGVNEWAARLPSAIAACCTILITYEIGRKIFNPATGLLAGLILASTVLFCAAAHFANPDALLCALCTLALGIFWSGYQDGTRTWFLPAAVAAGLAVLAKGPVGLVLPSAVAVLFLLWEGQWRRLWDRRLLWGSLVFVAVVVPWYAWVGMQTRSEFLLDFWLKHNVGRFQATMENHRGPFYYYLLCLIVGFAPWSVFFGPAFWFGFVRGETGNPIKSAYRFLACWVVVYVVFFSLSATKLPNYILPIYPAVALLSARFFDRWRNGLLDLAAWQMRGSLVCLSLVGMLTTGGLLLAGGVWSLPRLHLHPLPGLEQGAIFGIVPLFGAAVAWWCARRNFRGALLATITSACPLFVGLLGAWATVAVDAYKAPRPLIQAFPDPQADIRIACYQFYQPSLVFYCGREVNRLDDENQVQEFLRYPIPVYLFLPASTWKALEGKLAGPHHVVARHHDLYRNYQVMVVTNQ
jgi:4-amino-4-deoxy-L-arabinose transferase-like glycosyltransferase